VGIALMGHPGPGGGRVIPYDRERMPEILAQLEPATVLCGLAPDIFQLHQEASVREPGRFLFLWVGGRNVAADGEIPDNTMDPEFTRFPPKLWNGPIPEISNRC